MLGAVCCGLCGSMLCGGLCCELCGCAVLCRTVLCCVVRWLTAWMVCDLALWVDVWCLPNRPALQR